MADIFLSRRSFMRHLPLAAVAASLPNMATSDQCPAGSEPDMGTTWTPSDANMGRLRAKASAISVGDLINLDHDDHYFAQFPEAPRGVQKIALIKDTFIKVIGNDRLVPIERVV